MSAKELMENSRWLKGPAFLWEADTPLTSKASPSFEVPEDDPEDPEDHTHSPRLSLPLTAKTNIQQSYSIWNVFPIGTRPSRG